MRMTGVRIKKGNGGTRVSKGSGKFPGNNQGQNDRSLVRHKGTFRKILSNPSQVPFNGLNLGPPREVLCSMPYQLLLCPRSIHGPSPRKPELPNQVDYILQLAQPPATHSKT